MNIEFRARAGGALAVTVLCWSVAACGSQNPTSALPTSPSALSMPSDAAVSSGAAASTLAADKTGCPGLGNPGDNPGAKFIGLMSPQEALAASVAQITDAWYIEQGFEKDAYIAERLAGLMSVDKNGDGLLCVGQLWGANLNPNSHWAKIWADTLSPPATERWLFADNHNGTSNN